MSRRCSHLQPHSHRPAPPLAPACIFSRPVCNRVCPGGDVPPSSCRSSRAAPPRAPRRTSGWRRCCGRRVRGCVFEGAGLCLLLILVRRLACKFKQYFLTRMMASRSYLSRTLVITLSAPKARDDPCCGAARQPRKIGLIFRYNNKGRREKVRFRSRFSRVSLASRPTAPVRAAVCGRRGEQAPSRARYHIYQI